MTARLIAAAATAAGVAAILTCAIADAFAAMDRALSSYTVETPDTVPADWAEEDGR